jgi:hypothetical protein
MIAAPRMVQIALVWKNGKPISATPDFCAMQRIYKI